MNLLLLLIAIYPKLLIEPNSKASIEGTALIMEDSTQLLRYEPGHPAAALFDRLLVAFATTQTWQRIKDGGTMPNW